MDFINTLSASLKNNANNNAFYIKNKHYTYLQFSECVSGIRILIQKATLPSEKLIGLVTNDDLETYASIVALWLEGKGYIPVSPKSPKERNEIVLASTNSQHVLDSSLISIYDAFGVIKTKGVDASIVDLTPGTSISQCDIAYIIFTSGSTGIPKGVQISFKNLDGFVSAIDEDLNFSLSEKDRCLQMFELNFDMSVVSYLLPLLIGACIYTIPENVIKYFYVFKLLEQQQLTVLTLVASIIHYLRPYFKEINCEQVKYCSFAGGALHSDIIAEWSDCIPKSRIYNYYGPTETTIYSGFYPYKKGINTKAHNGIISIGTPMGDLKYRVVGVDNKDVSLGEVGELCITGNQVTPGYWNDETRNKAVFFTSVDNGESNIYYKTGDLCFKDEEGDYLFVGRVDFQVKIRGYRVELAEVEFYAKQNSPKRVNMVALTFINNLGNAELGLAIESDDFDIQEILVTMKAKLPEYMIPNHIKFIKEFPHNNNGKIDRKALRAFFDLKK